MGALSFAEVGPEPLGLYPIVHTLEWVKRLVPTGITTLQLRMKGCSPSLVASTLPQAIEVARLFRVRLFINDEWALAVQYKAYGVHLGQEDLQHANLSVIREAGLRLGISTHSDAEIQKAFAIEPSYIAFGAIFPTSTKPMATAPQGIDMLMRVREKIPLPLVAIGGINLSNIDWILQTQVDGIAMISAITQAEDPIATTHLFLERIAQRTCPPHFQPKSSFNTPSISN
ncbi:thiamine phosphate synthase [Pajaroellobacter abortibovis]|uniref:Thiamine-phosphate synthase n=1 Tax=Pajaroellobacter abortibovis TaxID=1882918 RepID=A0A1L6MWG2_9BACT|nr:thiamine phosphate synthase [Pajaroellobacter abortibovis]APR99748.1 thiamine-phosphate diphosphorylase [Pajaroellobacter abortibovis]